jgi:hypothetical protein
MTGGGEQFAAEPCPLCARPIVWAKDERAAMVPLDAEPVFGGTMSLRPGWDGVPMARRASAKLAFGVRLYVVHYTTCKKGAELRKRGR